MNRELLNILLFLDKIRNDKKTPKKFHGELDIHIAYLREEAGKENINKEGLKLKFPDILTLLLNFFTDS